MKWLNYSQIVIVLAGFVAAVVPGVGTAKADFTFGEPANLGPTVNSTYADYPGDISTDGLEMYIDSLRPGGQGDFDIWVTRRATIYDDWGPLENLGPVVNSPQEDSQSSLSSDGLELYFSSNRPGGGPLHFDIFVTTRANVSEPWGTPVNLGPPVNTTHVDLSPDISADGLELYFKRGHTGADSGFYVAKRDTKDAPWQVPASLGPVVNSWPSQWELMISSDGLLVVFADFWAFSPRPSGFGNTDLWLSLRPTKDGNWETPVNFGPTVNSSYGEDTPVIPGDGHNLYFGSSRPGGSGSADIWQAPIMPIVDLNGDGIVDAADMVIMVDHWGEDYSLCDIGPMPWGNGVVDVEDLKVLAEHLFEEVDDPTLIAHWPLDEEQGGIAYNNASDCDGTLIGGPVWQPDAGMVAGALQFDGIDDYIITDYVLIPAEGPFSVFAWIKGGAPGQAILSQTGAANWLFIDSVKGCLMTELRTPGRFGKVLLSKTYITDENWHRVALVWDGSYRHLYVDGVEVASDAEPLSGLIEPFGGLCIGTGINCGDGTFFSGLIDDVRIYNRAVHP